MDNSNIDADEKRPNQELEQLKQDAEEAGRMVKESLSVDEKAMSEDELVTFASAVGQLYLQKLIDHLETRDITRYMLLYIRFFKVGYKEAERRMGTVSYSPRVY